MPLGAQRVDIWCNITRSRAASQVTSPSLALFTGTFSASASCLPYSHTRYCGVVGIELSVISSVSQIRNCCLTFAIHIMYASITWRTSSLRITSVQTSPILMLLHQIVTSRENPLATFCNKKASTPFFVISVIVSSDVFCAFFFFRSQTLQNFPTPHQSHLKGGRFHHYTSLRSCAICRIRVQCVDRS